MAKKTVASLQSTGKDFSKVIRMVKSPATKSYTFKEEIIPTDQVKDYFAKK